MANGDPAEGSTFGNYRIERLIGSGGFGSVFLAQDLNPHLPRKVALKVLREPPGADPNFRQRFMRESMLAVDLDHHPNIVPIYDAGEFEGRLFMAMRFIDGVDLRSTIDTLGVLPIDMCVSVITQVAAALDTAHAAGMVHRDVKPGNILLSPDKKTAYLADFGVAKSLAIDSGLTTAGDFLGTVAYAAPEQLERHAVDARTDEYSLACVLFECLTATVPFDGDIAAVVAAHLTRPLPLASTVRPELPPAFDRVIARATEKAPSMRYPSCGQFASAVEGASRTAAAAGGSEAGASSSAAGSTVSRPLKTPVLAPAPPVAPKPGKRRRWPLLAGAGAILAAVLGVLLVVMMGGGGSGSFPDDQEAALLKVIPASLRASCERAGDVAQPDDGEVPAVVCQPRDGADEVTFLLFPTPLELDRAYDRRVEAQDVDKDTEGDCSEANETEGPYSTEDNAVGRLLCYRAAGSSFIVWTSDEFRVLATAERRDRDDSELYQWWAEFVDRTDPTTETTTTTGPDPDFPNAAEEDLLTRVPAEFRDSCSRADLLEAATASIVCSPTSGVDAVFYNQFPDAATMNAYYQALRDSVGVATDAGDETDVCPRERAYNIDGEIAGRDVCWVGEDDEVRIAWTADALAISSQAIRDDGNSVELFTWWRADSGPLGL